jgi:hypothetical protein
LDCDKEGVVFEDLDFFLGPKSLRKNPIFHSSKKMGSLREFLVKESIFKSRKRAESLLKVLCVFVM